MADENPFTSGVATSTASPDTGQFSHRADGTPFPPAGSAADDALGMDDSSGGRIVLPESYYPMAVQVVDYALTKNLPGEQVPELSLHATVVEGPYAGSELGKYDSRVLLSTGKEDGEGRAIGLVRHMVKAVTGTLPDAAALPRYNFPSLAGMTPQQAQGAFHQHFMSMTQDERLAFMGQYARVKQWDGKQAIVYVRVQESKEKDRTTKQVKVGADGNPVLRYNNRIGNIYAMNDEKHGLAQVKAVCFPVQLAAAGR